MNERQIISLLIEARLSKGWSRKKVSEKVGCSHESMNRWERMDRSPALEYLIRWAEVLGVELFANRKKKGG